MKAVNLGMDSLHMPFGTFACFVILYYNPVSVKFLPLRLVSIIFSGFDNWYTSFLQSHRCGS